MIKCRVLSGEEETLSFKPNLLKSREGVCPCPQKSGLKAEGSACF